MTDFLQAIVRACITYDASITFEANTDRVKVTVSKGGERLAFVSGKDWSDLGRELTLALSGLASTHLIEPKQHVPFDRDLDVGSALTKALHLADRMARLFIGSAAALKAIHQHDFAKSLQLAVQEIHGELNELQQVEMELRRQSFRRSKEQDLYEFQDADAARAFINARSGYRIGHASIGDDAVVEKHQWEFDQDHDAAVVITSPHKVDSPLLLIELATSPLYASLFVKVIAVAVDPSFERTHLEFYPITRSMSDVYRVTEVQPDAYLCMKKRGA